VTPANMDFFWTLLFWQKTLRHASDNGSRRALIGWSSCDCKKSLQQFLCYWTKPMKPPRLCERWWCARSTRDDCCVIEKRGIFRLVVYICVEMFMYMCIYVWMCDKYICLYICIHVYISRTFMSCTITHLHLCKCNHIFHNTHIPSHVQWYTCVIQTHDFWEHWMMQTYAQK